jgi:hypothetical protein
MLTRLLKPGLVVAAALASSLLLASPVPPAANRGPVTQLEWKSLLERARPGGVIELGKRRVEFAPMPFAPNANVTIRGGVFDELVLKGWRNVTFDGAVFEGADGASENHFLFVADKAENLILRNCRFSGYEAQDGKLQVRGPSIRESRNVTIERCTFERLAGFVNFVRTDGARFQDNHLKTIREGLQIVGGRNISIERNLFEDFRPFGPDHADGVQFFTTGLTRPEDLAARDVTIRDNLIIAAGKAQGIFSRDEIDLAASGRGYERFTIEGNIVIGAGWHGITASRIADVRIRNNRLFRVEDVDTMDSRISVDGGSGVVEDNEANAYILKGEVGEGRNRSQRNTPRRDVDAVVADWMKRFRKS